jgi:hypothetical protein
MGSTQGRQYTLRLDMHKEKERRGILGLFGWTPNHNLSGCPFGSLLYLFSLLNFVRQFFLAHRTEFHTPNHHISPLQFSPLVDDTCSSCRPWLCTECSKSPDVVLGRSKDHHLGSGPSSYLASSAPKVVHHSKVNRAHHHGCSSFGACTLLIPFVHMLLRPSP